MNAHKDAFLQGHALAFTAWSGLARVTPYENQSLYERQRSELFAVQIDGPQWIGADIRTCHHQYLSCLHGGVEMQPDELAKLPQVTQSGRDTRL